MNSISHNLLSLFGDYNPGGRLPYTFYPGEFTNKSDFFDMDMVKYPGRTYKYLQLEVQLSQLPRAQLAITSSLCMNLALV